VLARQVFKVGCAVIAYITCGTAFLPGSIELAGVLKGRLRAINVQH